LTHSFENKFSINASGYNVNKVKGKKEQASTNESVIPNQFGHPYMPMPMYYYPTYDQNYQGQAYPMVHHPYYYQQQGYNIQQSEVEGTHDPNLKTRKVQGSQNEVNSYQYRVDNVSL
jgi:hypothetical protein